MEAQDTLLAWAPRPRRVPTGCAGAVRFAAWVDEQLAKLRAGEQAQSLVAIHRAVLRLTWQYFYERKGSEPDHRDRVMDEDGGPCVYGVFLDALERLHELHMAAEKLELIERVGVTAAPPPPPRERSVAEAMVNALRDVV